MPAALFANLGAKEQQWRRSREHQQRENRARLWQLQDAVYAAVDRAPASQRTPRQQAEIDKLLWKMRQIVYPPIRHRKSKADAAMRVWMES